jgi:hypothetical protein
MNIYNNKFGINISTLRYVFMVYFFNIIIVYNFFYIYSVEVSKL